MVRDPSVYAELLGQKIRRHDTDCWLVNTGMTGGPYGVGHRIELDHTRAMVDAILDGTLGTVARTRDPVFGLSIPDRVPGVPGSVLTPRQTWDDPQAYDQHARDLVDAFADNFETYVEQVGTEVRTAGPSLETIRG
jgi:Phosphoenolpyruvate carboxykinase (ATP)